MTELQTQRHLHLTKPLQTLPIKQASFLILAVAGFLLTVLPGWAQGVQHLTIIQPGGMPGLPIMTGIQKSTNGVY
jgi:hypothetical protein